MNDFVGITVLAVAEGILGEAVVTVFRVRVQGACSGCVFRVRVQDKMKEFVDQIKFIFGLMDVVP